MARCVQDPGGKKPGVALVWKGTKGTGKGKVLEWFGVLFNPHYLQVTKPGQIVGRFNRHLAECILLFADEALFAGDKSVVGALNGLITEAHQMYEPKGIDATMLPSHINIIMATNEDFAIPATHDERRYCVTEVSDSRAKEICHTLQQLMSR